MKVFTEKEVEDLIRKAVTVTMEQTWEWVKRETEIVKKGTKIVSDEHCIDVVGGTKSLLYDYVSPALEKEGICIYIKK